MDEEEGVPVEEDDEEEEGLAVDEEEDETGAVAQSVPLNPPEQVQTPLVGPHVPPFKHLLVLQR